MKKTAKIFLLLGVMGTFMLGVTSCYSIGANKKNLWHPKKSIELVAPATAGGGWDKTAKSIQQVLQDHHFVSSKIKVVDKAGGSGEVGWKYLYNKGPETLAMNSSLILTDHLLGKMDLSFNDFTPIATLTSDWSVVVVPKDSTFNSAIQLLQKLKENPSSLRISVGSGLSTDDNLSFVEACLAYGVKVSKLHYLIYGSGEDQVNALLNHDVDVSLMSVSEIKKQEKEGKVKILAVTSPKKLNQLPGVKTWTEQGINVVLPQWRGIMGPPNMTNAQIAYWDNLIYKMVQTKEWKRILKKNEWTGFYKNSANTKKFLEQQQSKYQKLIKSASAQIK